MRPAAAAHACPTVAAGRMLILLNKPHGVLCQFTDRSTPPRPTLAQYVTQPGVYPAGRLDHDSEGLLLLTDDGALLHRIIAPRSQVAKVYVAELAHDLRGDEGACFASGRLMLESEATPLAPAQFVALGPRRARLTLHEGRYHQVRRMFTAVGNHVLALQRVAIGALSLDGLAAAQWRVLAPAEIERIFAPCVERET